mmetsp:Transcript_127188/g.406992  ORF Transcript_127188/g.406992 Transcript_127188/m.406992 type:complete len:338 (-) Transcript_127188:143-1156(-)
MSNMRASGEASRSGALRVKIFLWQSWRRGFGVAPQTVLWHEGALHLSPGALAVQGADRRSGGCQGFESKVQLAWGDARLRYASEKLQGARLGHGQSECCGLSRGLRRCSSEFLFVFEPAQARGAATQHRRHLCHRCCRCRSGRRLGLAGVLGRAGASGGLLGTEFFGDSRHVGVADGPGLDAHHGCLPGRRSLALPRCRSPVCSAGLDSVGDLDGRKWGVGVCPGAAGGLRLPAAPGRAAAASVGASCVASACNLPGLQRVRCYWAGARSLAEFGRTRPCVPSRDQWLDLWCAASGSHRRRAAPTASAAGGAGRLVSRGVHPGPSPHRIDQRVGASL